MEEVEKNINPAINANRVYVKRKKAETKNKNSNENSCSIDKNSIEQSSNNNNNDNEKEAVKNVGDAVTEAEVVAVTGAITVKDEPVDLSKSNQRRLSLCISNEGKKRNFFCDIAGCHASFIHRASYLQHIRMNHEASSSMCKLCFKRFSNCTELLEHQMQVHNGRSKKVYSCTGHCEKTFTSVQYRNRHVQRVRKQGNSSICNFCNKIFHNRSDLSLHLKCTHPENRKFTCKECGKAFKRQTHVVSHMKQHLPTENFTCNICNRDFTTLNFLKRHSKVHSANEYRCNVCSAGFTHKISLIKHLKKQHPKFFESMPKVTSKKGGRVYQYKL